MISAPLIKWYKQNARDLPWRNSSDPYKIWLSEIILQQTRVAQGLPYYQKFTEEFPTVFDLAKAPEQKVLKLWQGLGYYSRARNLHHAAKQIVKEYKGVFPNEFNEIKKLKGVGDYTASAIASFCFNKPHAVVDGNVYRVLSRLFAIKTPIDSTEGKKQFAGLADELLDKKNPGTYNQAIMEFGAMYCTPSNPDCTNCVLKEKCLSGPRGKANEYPVKSQKVKIRTRYFEYFFITQKQNSFLQKRTEKDIWQNLYQFPLLEFSEDPSKQVTLKRLEKEIFAKPAKFEVKKVSARKKHQLSHQTILARFWHISAPEARLSAAYKPINIKNIKKYPFPVLLSNHLDEIGIFEKNHLR
ncbi:MAG: A/G-specific adenine glycosylase [Bacteroidia bacterium]